MTGTSTGGTAIGTVGALVQLLLVAVGAPLLVGAMRQVRARLEGRAGAGVLQPWRELRKLLGKQAIRPEGTTVVFNAAPVVLAASTLLIVLVVPIVTVASPFDRIADLFAVVGLLLLGTVALALAGLDTGTAFGGMGSSREMMIAALAEPAILLAVFGLSIPAHSSNLAVIVTTSVHHPATVLTPAAALAAAAMAIVVLAETGRLPIDNPSTHLELTMVHEAMVLEYTGPALALVEWAAAMRLTVLLALFANLFVPFGIATAHAGVAGLPTAMVVIAAKVGVLAVAIATGELFMAKLRLFRVPELLAGSVVLGLFAVVTSSFLTTAAG
jgi:formate hydrogenlyase subunit 4